MRSEVGCVYWGVDQVLVGVVHDEVLEAPVSSQLRTRNPMKHAANSLQSTKEEECCQTAEGEIVVALQEIASVGTF